MTMANHVQTHVGVEVRTDTSGLPPCSRTSIFWKGPATKKVSQFDELAGGLFWKPDDIILMIWGYFDESFLFDRQSNRPELVAIGGALASLETWQQLSAQWTEVIN